MRIALRHVLLAAIASGVYLKAYARPYIDEKSDLTLERRAPPIPRPRPAEVEPHDIPEVHPPTLGGAGGVPGAGGHIGGLPNYQRPASYKNFPAKGLQVQEDLHNAIAAGAARADNDWDYSTKIQKYFPKDIDDKVPFQIIDKGELERSGNHELSLLANLRATLGNNGLNGNTAWREHATFGTQGDLDADASAVVSKSYHNKDEEAFIVTDSFNDELGRQITADVKLYHSELWFQAWRTEAGPHIADLKYIVRAQIWNPDSKAIIADARRAVSARDSDAAIFSPMGETDAEKDAFNALAGTENGKQVFRMLADHHNEMNGKTVALVEAYPKGDEVGSVGPSLIWFLH